MHPGFFSFIRNSGKIRTVISTNGHFLTDENCEKIVRSGLSKLIISLDGLDQDTYSAYRCGGNLETVMDGIRNITETRKSHRSSLKIELQVLINRLNEHQIPQMRRLAADFNIGLKIKSMQIISKDRFGSWLPVDGNFSRYS